MSNVCKIQGLLPGKSEVCFAITDSPLAVDKNLFKETM